MRQVVECTRHGTVHCRNTILPWHACYHSCLKPSSSWAFKCIAAREVSWAANTSSNITSNSNSASQCQQGIFTFCWTTGSVAFVVWIRCLAPYVIRWLETKECDGDVGLGIRNSPGVFEYSDNTSIMCKGLPSMCAHTYGATVSFQFNHVFQAVRYTSQRPFEIERAVGELLLSRRKQEFCYTVRSFVCPESNLTIRMKNIWSLAWVSLDSLDQFFKLANSRSLDPRQWNEHGMMPVSWCEMFALFVWTGFNTASKKCYPSKHLELYGETGNHEGVLLSSAMLQVVWGPHNGHSPWRNIKQSVPVSFEPNWINSTRIPC